MPIREYHCNECGEDFEYFSQKRDEEPEKCRYCRSPEIEKQISAHGVGGISRDKGDDSLVAVIDMTIKISPAPLHGDN